VGIAYISAICEEGGSWSFSLTQRFHPATDVTIFTHEIGHNLSAEHDTSDEGSIMYPAASVPGATRWSNLSINEISRFIQQAECLFSSSAEPPTPTPTSVPNTTAGPGATPARTPTPVTTVGPTPTFRPPSGGGPGTSPTLAPPADYKVSLAGRISRTGSVKFTVTLDTWNNGCSVLLIGGSAETGVPDETLVKWPLVSLRQSFTGRSTVRSKGRFEVRARLECSGIVADSASLSLRMSGETTRSVRAANWLKRFKRSLRPAR
jgi:hypothetical protein